jgi:hypothetical protein
MYDYWFIVNNIMLNKWLLSFETYRFDFIKGKSGTRVNLILIFKNKTNVKFCFSLKFKNGTLYL